jgi:hypothetical protein
MIHLAWINGIEVGRYGIGISGDRPAWNAPLILNHEAGMYRNLLPAAIFQFRKDFARYLKNGSNIFMYTD